eukprot:6749553-Pyramimonas_sp.AAC.3
MGKVFVHPGYTPLWLHMCHPPLWVHSTKVTYVSPSAMGTLHHVYICVTLRYGYRLCLDTSAFALPFEYPPSVVR